MSSFHPAPLIPSIRSAFQWCIPETHPVRQQWMKDCQQAQQANSFSDSFVPASSAGAHSSPPKKWHKKRPDTPKPKPLSDSDAVGKKRPDTQKPQLFTDRDALMSGLAEDFAGQMQFKSSQTDPKTKQSMQASKQNASRSGHLASMAGQSAPFRGIAPKEDEWIQPRSLLGMMQGSDLSVKQGSMGNCYWVAAMDAAFRHSRGKALMERIKVEISPNAKGGVKKYRITFPSGRWGAFYAGEVGQVKHGRAPLEGPKPLLMLELAYAKMTRHYRNSWRDEPYPNHGRGLTPIIVEGGFAEDALLHMFGGKGDVLNATDFAQIGFTRTEPFSLNLRACKALKSRLEKMKSDSKHDYLLCAKTPDFTKTSKSIRTKDTGKEFERQHTYAIHSFDLEENQIIVANPHDTSKEEVLTFDEFCQVFSALSGIKLPKEEPG